MKPFSRQQRCANSAKRQSRRLRLESLEARQMLSTTPPLGGFDPNEDTSDLLPQPLGAIPGQVVINEIMYHPDSENTQEEYIELYNNTGSAVNVQQWELKNAVRFTLPDVIIPEGDFLVIAADVPTFQVKYPSVTNVVGGWDGQLSNHTESIELHDNTGQLVDELTYADEGTWSVRARGPLDFGHEGWIWDSAHDGGGASLELRQADLPNEYGQNWGASSTSQGTPGAANSIAVANSAPLIVGAAHSPVIPSSTDAVTVSATLFDEATSGLTVQVFYRLDGAASFTALTMFDDGAHNDGSAGDDVYAAQLPAQTDGSIVEFYVQASDSSANTATSPTPSEPSGQQLTNFLYQVDNSFNPNDPSVGSEFPSYRLIMTDAERAELADIGSIQAESRSHAQMNGTLITINGDTVDLRYTVGIRNRGETSRIRQPNSYHVEIPSDNPWQAIDKFNLNTQYTNLQLAGLTLYRLAGYASEGGQAVSVLVNGNDLSSTGSPSFGKYIHVGAADGAFVESQFPGNDGGNLYRIVRSSTGSARGDLRVLADVDEYRTYYDKKTNKSEDDYSDLIDLVDKLNNTPDGSYLSTVEQVVDIDSWLAYFAISAIYSTEETSLAIGIGDDYMLYRGDNDPRFKLVPHDFDTIFGQGDDNSSPSSGIYRATSNPVIDRFLNHEAILPRYHTKLYELLTTTFSKAQIDPVLFDLLAGFTPTNVIDAMIDFMDQRRDYILGLIDGQLTIDSHLPQTNGYRRTTQNIAAVEGTASQARTQSVLVNGQLADWDPSSGTWSLGESLGGNTETLIAEGSNWHYLDAGNVPSTTPGNDWRIDDPGWTDSGNAQLGYGDSDETTVVNYIDTDPGTSGTQKNITTYFRKTFQVADASEVTSLTMRLLRDDGAVVYLNGQEVARPNMPDGVTITSTTRAVDTVSGGDEDTFFTSALDQTKLIDGQNVIAVEIHQVNDTSSDISFDLELTATIGNPGALSGIALRPGINRLTAESYTGPNGTGEMLESAYVDVWYDTGSTQDVGGTINTNTTWSIAGGPYRVTSDLIVNGATLTIEPGTTVLFEGGTGMTITGTGRVVAVGTEFERIHFAYNPTTSNSWEGMRITNTQSDNQFAFIDFVGGADQGEALYINAGRATFDNASWSGFQQQVMDLIHPTMVVSNSNIPGISGDETIHLFGLNQGERMDFFGNIIGKNTSGGDVFDLGHDTLTPPTVYFRDNIFLGGLDDGIDTDGFPVVIENNLFQDFHLNVARTTTSNAVSSGHMNVGGQIISSDLQLIGNIFIDNDHHLLLKDFSSAVLTHNTMVDASVAAISLHEIPGTSVIGPGSALTMDGNIVVGYPNFFQDRQPSTTVEINRSIVPTSVHSDGVGNIDADPRFKDPYNRDFGLKADSPALGTGPDGTNMGAVQNNLADSTNLRITEINYNPAAALLQFGELDVDNDEFEFLEFMNSTDAPIDLTGVQLTEVTIGPETDGVVFTFGNIQLGAGERIVVVRNEAAFQSRYGTSANIAGTYVGRLSNGGELLTVLAANGDPIQSFSYADSGKWPGRADGTGATLVVIDTAGDYAAPGNWNSSEVFGGTPGAAPNAPIFDVLVNEVLANTDALLTDTIELHNTTGAPVDLSRWYLSDSNGNLLKYQFPLGSQIPANGYLLLNESDFNPGNGAGANDFALSSGGDDVWLVAADANGYPTRFVDHVDFDATLPGVTLGRLPNGDPDAELFPLVSSSLGAVNGPHQPGSVVISEVHYHPAGFAAPFTTDQQLEFVELYNSTGSPIDLTDWRLRGGSDFDFAAGTMIASHEVVVVVGFDPANTTLANAFRTLHSIAPGVQLLGPLAGNLDNDGDSVRLLAPTDPPLGEIGPVHYLVDRVIFNDAAPWPLAADGGGNSLTRKTETNYGDNPTSWRSAAPSPGSTLFGIAVPGDTDGDNDVDGADFLRWQRGYSITTGATLTDGDTNADGAVNVNDLNVWQDYYGTTAAPLSAAAATSDAEELQLAAISTSVSQPEQLPLESESTTTNTATDAAFTDADFTNDAFTNLAAALQRSFSKAHSRAARALEAVSNNQPTNSPRPTTTHDHVHVSHFAHSANSQNRLLKHHSNHDETPSTAASDSFFEAFGDWGV